MDGSTPISRSELTRIQQTYRKRFGFALVCVNPGGKLLHAKKSCPDCDMESSCREVRRRSVLEALRWGEPCINVCPGERAMWAVPLMNNEKLTGGLVATGISLDNKVAPDKASSRPLLEACQELLRMAEAENLTNGALLKLRRQETEMQRERAVALHSLKESQYDDIRAIYLREEPFLLAAIKRGERKAAREIINRVLLGIYHLGRNRLEYVKSFVLELIIMMCRAAVEAGGEPGQILGSNYESVASLAQIRDEEALCHWLTRMLERVMDGIHDNRKYPNTVLLENAMRHIEAHLQEDIGRDDVARIACLSPSHFSRLLRKKTGWTFTELMGMARVNKAREMLVRTGKGLTEIAIECGFCDQSYFTKVFRKQTGLTPRDYRLRHAPRQDNDKLTIPIQT
ncbi:MAG: helix-turn-helix domain-containing protein [Verrucomicrobiae bacterium]|nr:helix-turn-helix domain-containing protein [Verrucomicrobiae bacterium]